MTIMGGMKLNNRNSTNKLNKDNEIAAMYVNCQIESINMTYDRCKKIYELYNEQNLSQEDVLRLINEDNSKDLIF
jgi:hypothetical protein